MYFHRQHYLVLWRLLFWALSANVNPMLGIYRIFIHSYWVMCVSLPIGHNNCIRVIFVPCIILPALSCQKSIMPSPPTKFSFSNLLTFNVYNYSDITDIDREIFIENCGENWTLWWGGLYQFLYWYGQNLWHIQLVEDWIRSCNFLKNIIVISFLGCILEKRW